MAKDFGLVRKGDLFLLRRLIYPHYKALVDLKRSFPEFKEIVFLDACCVAEMANAINEGGLFLESFIEPEERGHRKPPLALSDLALVMAFQLARSFKVIAMLGFFKFLSRLNR